MIRVTPSISIDESELSFDFVRSSGPGGQNVNKVATAVQLRFDAARTTAFGEDVFARLKKLAGSRMTREGVVIITAQRYRTQERNREDAVDRLVRLVARAAYPPRKRKPTRPTRAAKERRLDEKKRRAQKKRQRGPVRPGDD
jgi:ribosome-associated protein